MTQLRRFAVIGDIHAEDRLLDKVLDTLEAMKVEAILSVGDIVDGHGDPARTVRLLQRVRAVAVRGNHDRWLLANTGRTIPQATKTQDLAERELAWLRALPASRTVATTKGDLLLCHGLGDHDLIDLADDEDGRHPELAAIIEAKKWRYLVHGHSHKPRVRVFEGLTLINAGTLHRDDRPCFSVVDLDAGSIVFHAIEGGVHVVEWRVYEI